MKSRLALATALTALLLVLVPAHAAPASVDELAMANAAYEAGRYAEAREGYQALVDAGVHHETVYYNLGCATARLGRYGEAVLAFRRALRYAPGHEDARVNLDWVRTRASESFAGEPGARALLEKAAALMPLNAGLLGGLILINAAALLAALALARRRTRPGRLLIPAALLVAIVGLLILAPALLQLWLRQSERGAVVLQARLEARSGPGEAHPTLFSAHEGLELELIDQRAGWARVSVPSGPSGWVPCGGIESVAPGRLTCAEERRGGGNPSR